jgi:hypothetical protein
MEIGFIDHLQVVTKSGYNIIAKFTLYKSLQHPLIIFNFAVFTSRILVTASNSGDSQLNRLSVLSTDSLTND